MNHMAPVKHVLSVQVTAEFDDEANVWVATSEDVPGLVVEHADLGELRNMVLELVPILMVENGLIPDSQVRPFEIPVHIAASALTRGNAVISD